MEKTTIQVTTETAEIMKREAGKQTAETGKIIPMWKIAEQLAVKLKEDRKYFKG